MIYIRIHASYIHVYVCVLSPYYVSILEHTTSAKISNTVVCVHTYADD